MINPQVKDAEKRAIEEYKKTHPDIDENNLKVRSGSKRAGRWRRLWASLGR
jgi:hypothetical protein